MEGAKFNFSSNAYFNSLPKLVQETIMQSAGNITNEEQLRKTAEAVMKNLNTNN